MECGQLIKHLREARRLSQTALCAEDHLIGIHLLHLNEMGLESHLHC